MKRIIFVAISIITLASIATESPRKHALNPITLDPVSGNVESLIGSLKTTLYTAKTDRLKAYKSAIKTDDTDVLLDYDKSDIQQLINTIVTAIKNKIMHADDAMNTIKLLQTFYDEYKASPKRDNFFAMNINNALSSLYDFYASYDIEGAIEKLRLILSTPRQERLEKYRIKHSDEPSFTKLEQDNPRKARELLEQDDTKEIENLINAISKAIDEKIDSRDFDNADKDIISLEEFNTKNHTGDSFLKIIAATGRLRNRLDGERPKSENKQQKRRSILPDGFKDGEASEAKKKKRFSLFGGN